MHLFQQISATTPEMQAQLDCLIHGICPMPDKKQRKISSTESVQQQQIIEQNLRIISMCE